MTNTMLLIVYKYNNLVYSWIGPQVHAHEKSISKKPERAMTNRWDHLCKALDKKNPDLLCLILCDPF